jgi:hypothetical protein
VEFGQEISALDRQQYKCNKLSLERIQKLNEVGFVLEVQEAQWFEKFEELKE